MLPDAMYDIIIIGTTISLAGRPKIKASSITPSIPRSFANGSRKSEQWLSNVEPPTETFAITHIMSPAGAATTTALANTNNVLSKIERTMILPICGLR